MNFEPKNLQILARAKVVQYFNSKVEKTDGFKLVASDVHVVWFVKTLQNWKALLVTNVPDGMYYELTYNGDKGETYLDAYKKTDNLLLRHDKAGDGVGTAPLNTLPYQEQAMFHVRMYHKERFGSAKLKAADVYVVWFAKSLQNWKTLISTTISDGMYYEVTYNGNLNVAYLDAYKKFDNTCFKD